MPIKMRPLLELKVLISILTMFQIYNVQLLSRNNQRWQYANHDVFHIDKLNYRPTFT